jgi:hypothetical protein
VARDLKISRNTVRKILRSGDTSFSYEREVQPLPQLDRWKADLDRLLAANAGTSARERSTLIRLFEELRLLGYDGGYDAVRRCARTWRWDTRARRRPLSCRYRSRQARRTSSTGAMRLSW